MTPASNRDEQERTLWHIDDERQAFKDALREIESLPDQTEAYSPDDTAVAIARRALEKTSGGI